MSKRIATSALIGVGLFLVGWCGGYLTGGDSRAVAQGQSGGPALDQTMQAVMYGVATIAVDAEAAAMRIAELGDRHAALERRVAALEAQAKR
jgi:hypothetical protein